MLNYYENRRQRIMARFTDGPRILDVGCSERPNPYLQGKEIVGLDMINMEIKPPYSEHITGDIKDIDTLLAGRRFDTILMGEFIKHIERPYDVLRSLHAHILPGSSLLLSTPNPLGIPVVVAPRLTATQLPSATRGFGLPRHGLPPC